MGRLQLGPFDVHDLLGEGGMGRVYAGEHAESGVRVAIKVLHVAHDLERSREAFRNEVRAVAGLAHPHVVWVLDYGDVDAAAVRASAGQLRVGLPYLVMERADEGSLAALRGTRIAFPRLRRLLMAMLDGLAHAHARGVVHRDLKPSNVLMGGLRPGLKLADFGLAHLAARARGDAVLGSAGGTPAYMAPEQFRDAWRDQGPWTDLYALGVLGWRLSTGRRPFTGNGWAEMMRAHLEQALPPLTPLAPVPEGFEAWLQTCLAKDPGNRFQRAADAAWALDQLAWGPDVPTGADAEPEAPEGERLNRTTLIWPERTASTVRERYAEPAGPTTRSTAMRHARPPVPGRWTRGDAPPPPLPLVGTGLRLFGLREVPLVARQAERDALWDVVRRVGRRGGVRAVVLRGAAGCGKSRLARWVCERAHEVGAMALFEASHSPIPGPLDGIGPMLARHHRCDDLPRDQGLARIRSLRPAEASDTASIARAELIWPTSLPERAAGAPAVHFRTGADRHRVVEQVLLEVERPSAVWLDDVQWGPEAIALCAWLLDRQRCAAALVLTVRDEALASRPAEAAALDALCARDDVVQVDVAPLDGPGRRALVRQLLPLADTLAVRLEERSAGSPLFAVQCVGHWVASDALELRGDGFQLRDGIPVALPDDLAAVWTTRIDRLLLGRPDADGHALELAAALGQEVDGSEWRAACGALGLTADPGLVEELMVERLAVPGHSATGFAFAHGMLREALELRSREAGRWTAHNAACAGVLADSDGPGLMERIGSHLLAAERHEDALEPLRKAFDEHLNRDDLRQAERLLADWNVAFSAIGGTDADIRSADGRLRWVVLKLVRLEADAAETELQRLWADNERHAWAETPDRLYMLTGALHKARSELREAAARYRQAKEVFDGRGDLGGIARACKNLAECHVLLGEHREGEAAALEGLQAAEAEHDDYVAAILSHIPAIIALREQRLDDAESWAHRCADHARRIGNQVVQAQALLVIGGVREHREDLDGAQEVLERSLVLAGDERTVARASAQLALAILSMRRGLFVDADAGLEQILADVGGRWRVLEAVTHLGLAACAAALVHDAKMQQSWAKASEILASSGYVDPDVSFLASILARHARPLRPAIADAAEELIASQDRVLAGH